VSRTGADTETAADAAVARWQQAGPALARVRREELRRLTDADAIAAVEDLLDLLHYLPAKDEMSGLVEQQRLFARRLLEAEG
jgi:hypothetical protein